MIGEVLYRILPNYCPGVNNFKIRFDPALLGDQLILSIEYEKECKTLIQMKFDPAFQ